MNESSKGGYTMTDENHSSICKCGFCKINHSIYNALKERVSWYGRERYSSGRYN